MIGKYPFISLRTALILLRVGVALIFIAHAVVRLLNGTIPRFAEYLQHEGMPVPLVLVWGITAFEIAGGLLLCFGHYTRWLTAGFVLLLLAGIMLIHVRLGWFVGEHGTGGCEYSVVLILALLVVAATDGRGADSKVGRSGRMA